MRACVGACVRARVRGYRIRKCIVWKNMIPITACVLVCLYGKKKEKNCIAWEEFEEKKKKRKENGLPGKKLVPITAYREVFK